MRSRARSRRAGVAQGDPRGARASGLAWAEGGVEGLVSHPPPEDGRPAPLQGKPLSGDRYHPGAADCPRPGPERTLRKREAGPGRAWRPMEVARSQKEGPRRGCRGRLSKRRGPARASPCAEPAKPWRSSKTSQPKASFAPAAEWEGGGPARAPPSPPAVTGAITLLAADGYQLASASLSRFPSPRLPSPPVPNCWLHLSERGREARLRPAASGDVARLLARRAPPRSPGRGLRTAQCVALAPQPRKGLSRSLEDPLSTRCKTLATALYPATLPPASAATLALQIPGAPRFSISLPPSSPCATQMPTGRLDHSEAFALLGLPLHAKRPCPLLPLRLILF